MAVNRQPNKPGLLTLTIKDKSALYLAYMPFVKNGGLFIPTSSNYRLGDEVFMLLNLMGADDKLPVAGRVIWLPPPGAPCHLPWGRVARPRWRTRSKTSVFGTSLRTAKPPAMSP